MGRHLCWDPIFGPTVIMLLPSADEMGRFSLQMARMVRMPAEAANQVFITSRIPVTIKVSGQHHQRRRFRHDVAGRPDRYIKHIVPRDYWIDADQSTWRSLTAGRKLSSAEVPQI